MQTKAKSTTAAKQPVKLLGFPTHCKIEIVGRWCWKTLLKKASYPFPNAIPSVIIEEGFVKTRTNCCCYSTAWRKNSINSCITDASLAADAVKNQAGYTKLSEVIHISCCCLRALNSGTADTSPIAMGKALKLLLCSQPPRTCPFSCSRQELLR